MKRTILLICTAILFASCGGAKSTIDINYDGKQIPFETKSAWITAQNALYGSGASEAEKKHALRWITLRNYDYQVTRALGANDGKLEKEGQVKLFLSIHDEAGTDEKTPVKPATYSAASEGPLQFEFINLTIFKDGKEESHQVSVKSQPNKQDSSVKITAVNGDTVTGEVTVNVKSKDKVLTIKGPFTAKILKQ